jgi:hypothetical protein
MYDYSFFTRSNTAGKKVFGRFQRVVGNSQNPRTLWLESLQNPQNLDRKMNLVLKIFCDIQD